MNSIAYYLEEVLCICLMFIGALMIIIPIINILQDAERMRRWRAPEHDSLLMAGIIVCGFCVFIAGISIMERLFP